MSIFDNNRELLDRFRRGDRAALAEVYEHYVDDVALLARRGFTIESAGHRSAQDAKQRYDRDRAAAIATGVVALGAGVAAYWLWPRAHTTIAPVVSARDHYAISLVTRW